MTKEELRCYANLLNSGNGQGLLSVFSMGFVAALEAYQVYDPALTLEGDERNRRIIGSLIAHQNRSENEAKKLAQATADFSGIKPNPARDLGLSKKDLEALLKCAEGAADRFTVLLDQSKSAIRKVEQAISDHNAPRPTDISADSGYHYDPDDYKLTQEELRALLG